MKKMIALVMALCMACMLVPAMAEDEITGTWYLVEMTMGEQSFNPADMGMSMTYILNEDGTLAAELVMGDATQTQEGTWSLDGNTVTLAQESGETTGTFADGYIIIDSEGQTGILSKEPPAASAKVQAVAAESEEVFFGTWTLTGVDMMGMYIAKENLTGTGLAINSATMTIESGKVTAVTDMGDEMGTQTTNATYVFEDGKLLLTIEVPEDQAAIMDQLNQSLAGAAEGAEVPQMDFTKATVELLEDGTLLYSADFLGMQMGMYYAPAEAAE